MRTFLILAAAFGVAYAGVRELTPSEEADALDLFNRLCSGYGSDGQDVGGTRVYCKRANGEINESQNHRPPPARYQHNVEIVSEGGEGGQTKIYVLPQQATHTVTPNVQQNPGSQTKPVVYFLKGGSSSSSVRGQDPGYGAPPPPPQIRDSYGAPPQAQPVLRSSYGAPEVNQGGYTRVARDTVPSNYRDYPIIVENV
ncbi:hypothetical protein Ocin01_08945 [Orchesella cincta]|uniref:DUF243 domain-containing protein n=1 Tax=Orchesella cincta TaxID=48709 RepID=A0A1D2MXG4_ORCCI|nr:hypothetical protein Ocin01_08945 [Orchesella cincta]